MKLLDSTSDSWSTAGNLHGGRSHVARILRSEQYIDWSKLSRLTSAFQRNILTKRFYFLGRHGRRNERSPYRARSNTIDTYSFFSPQLSQRRRKVLNSPFCRSIGQ